MVAAQTAKANKDTAIANARMSAVNQSGPYGNLTFQETGLNPDGTPKFSANYNLDPGTQGIYDNITRNVSAATAQPFRLGNDAVEARLMELGRARLDPIFDQQRKSLETQLLNSGYRPGTEAWDQRMGQVGRNQNDAYTQLLLSGRGQSVSETLAERNQPLQEYSSLTSSRPFGFNGLPTPSGTVAPTDTAGIYNNSYQNQLAAYGLDQKQNSAMMGGLFGLGGSVLTAPMTGGTSLAGYFGSKLLG
jgi:hypothetical protein